MNRDQQSQLRREVSSGQYEEVEEEEEDEERGKLRPALVLAKSK